MVVTLFLQFAQGFSINKNSDSLIFVINIDRRRYISQKTGRSVQKLSCSMYCSFVKVTAFVIYEFLLTGDMHREFPVFTSGLMKANESDGFVTRVKAINPNNYHYVNNITIMFASKEFVAIWTCGLLELQSSGP